MIGFKPIPGCSDYIINRTGRVYSLKTQCFLKYNINNSGYPRVSVWIRGIRFQRLVHRLVGILFVENPDEKLKIELDHIDRNKLNPRWDNLRWVTSKENKANIDRMSKKDMDEFYRDLESNVCENMEPILETVPMFIPVYLLDMPLNDGPVPF